MNYNIKGTEVAVTPELRSYVEKKLSQADKFTRGDSAAHTDVELEHSAVRDGGKYRAEFTAAVGGTVYRAEEWGSTMHEAIDLAVNRLTRELRRDKKKNLRLVRHGAAKFKDFVRGLRKGV